MVLHPPCRNCEAGENCLMYTRKLPVASCQRGEVIGGWRRATAEVHQQPITTYNSSLSKKFDDGIDNFGADIVGELCGFTFHVLHQAFEIVTGIGNADDAHGGPLPEVGRVDFCDGNIEGVP